MIVDDASDDYFALMQLVDRYKGQLKIALIRLDFNGGASCARNVGVQSSSSRYVAFLDSDDIWHPQKIEIQYGYMKQNAADLTGHGYIYNLHDTPFPELPELPELVVKDIRKCNYFWGNPLFTPTVMALREKFVYFDPRFRRVDDYKCWYENFLSGHQKFLGLYLAGGYKHPIGASGLTKSARLMHQSYLDVLRVLYDEGKMSRGEFLLAVLFESLKYPIRCLLINFRKS